MAVRLQMPSIPPISQVLDEDAFRGARIGVLSAATIPPSRSGRPMPKIPETVLESVVYMYEDEGAALHGLEFGGTGFLVGYPSTRFSNMMSLYVVTNWHVAVRGHTKVVRTNRKDGKPYIVKIDEWFHDYKHDIAVAPFPAHLPDLDCALIQPSFFVSKAEVERHSLGPGEDVFMVGRFVDHDGGATNRPAVRFGNISVMPTPLDQPTGHVADTYCIDMHSRPGYSGSPVFVYRTPGYDLTRQIESGAQTKLMIAGVNFFGLLGIHYDQFPEPWPIIGKLGELPPVKHEGPVIRGLSGMTKVLPAWSILEVLDMPILKESRARQDEEHAQSLAMQGTGESSQPTPLTEGEVAPETDNPSHKEDFTRLLNAAVKANKPAS